ncbi:MAG: UDP-N-acetylmuramoyl-tripeptide--D-alanyl-D-alanine ligase [Clostridia bacterium]|nr:UDP-N-acetylmuramoyl-tripeptide--D-alanyl-D-alanine ligase [Clostridia bacterium]
MLKLTCKDILEATGGSLLFGSLETEILRISTDSRKIEHGDLFIPIAGERFDGHDFVQSSLEAGASAVISHKALQYAEGKTAIKVGDTRKALADIARFYRMKFDIPFVAITGSVGKTSTKDMVYCVMQERFNTLKTEGNFNNEIGLPLTMFNLDPSHDAGVLELGMSGFGEISRLVSVVRPDIAIITNIGMAHIEKLGSRQNILKAKMEILEGLKEGGLLILNGDDPLLHGLKDFLKVRTVFYGMDEGHDYQAYNIESHGESGTKFEINISQREYKVHVPVPGIHNVYNALAAIAAGIELKIPMELVVNGISKFTSGKMRLNIINHNGFKIINDAYNASPQSMEAALGVLSDVASGGRTVAVLGDMLELGDWSLKAHKDLGKFAISQGIKYIITVGENARGIAEGAMTAGAEEHRVFSFEETGKAAEFLGKFVKQGDTVLVKGSRGMKMEQIVDKLIQTEK